MKGNTSCRGLSREMSAPEKRSLQFWGFCCAALNGYQGAPYGADGSIGGSAL